MKNKKILFCFVLRSTFTNFPSIRMRLGMKNKKILFCFVLRSTFTNFVSLIETKL